MIVKHGNAFRWHISTISVTLLMPLSNIPFKDLEWPVLTFRVGLELVSK